jgi:single-strand DNA-binding protein
MLNNIVLQGRLTRSPEMKATASGISCATFTLACEQDYKNPNGERDTDFFDVVAWRGTGDFVQRYFVKGQMAVVNGRLQTSQWTAQDGSKRKAVQIVAENVYFCGANNASGQDTEQATEQPAAVEESGFTPVETDELPF